MRAPSKAEPLLPQTEEKTLPCAPRGNQKSARASELTSARTCEPPAKRGRERVLPIIPQNRKLFIKKQENALIFSKEGL